MSERLAEMVRGLAYPYALADRDDLRTVWNLATDAAADLIANSSELAEMRAKARRYDYVRENHYVTIGGVGCKGNELDAAIDAAQLGEGT